MRRWSTQFASTACWQPRGGALSAHLRRRPGAASNPAAHALVVVLPLHRPPCRHTTHDHDGCLFAQDCHPAAPQGSFGSATLVEVVDTRERFVAKKISMEHMGEDEKTKALNEAALLRSLHHPHITEYFGSFIVGNTLHIIMEYCSGGSLQQVMARRERADERFDEVRAVDSHSRPARALARTVTARVAAPDARAFCGPSVPRTSYLPPSIPTPRVPWAH